MDLWSAEVVIELKKQNNSLRLIAASAFEGMEKEWDSLWQKRYYHVFDSADEKLHISENPGRRAFFQRNHWMVDHSIWELQPYLIFSGVNDIIALYMVRYRNTGEWV